MIRKNIYSQDRSDSDNYFYNSKKVIEILEKSRLYGNIIQNLRPAKKFDDNEKATDTYINNIPAQIRIQFKNNKKGSSSYYPTLRYERKNPPYNETETRKLIKMYDNKEKIPHLIWMLVDKEKDKIIQCIIVDLEKIMCQRKKKYDLDNTYKLTNDYDEIKNTDNKTSFLILNKSKDYLKEFNDS